MRQGRTLVGIAVAAGLLVVSGGVVALSPTRGSRHPTGPSSPPGASSTMVAAAASSAPGVLALSGVVASVVDGDTVNVVDDKGGQVRVRVLGIDTPETKDPRKPVQCWGPEASAYAERTLFAKRVSLYTDPTQAVHDAYGRLLAYVVLADGGVNYSVAAAGAGAARSYVY